MIGLVKFYQRAISPLFPLCCRYIPSCSAYGLESFQRFGFRRGLILTVKRIARCRPGGSYGFDPVPETWDEYLESKKQAKALKKFHHSHKPVATGVKD